MNKISRTSTNPTFQGFMPYLQFNKSPLRRNTNPAQNNIVRSPIRSRTPTRYVSPIKNTNQNQPTIKFISNVSPIRDKYNEFENQGEFSNGKSIKYINNLINDKFYQSNRKDNNQQFNKKSDRNMQDQNRLFGKLVDKLNSEKKNGLKSNQNSYKTSVFIDLSEKKLNKIQQNHSKNQGTITKSPYKIHKELRTQSKNSERAKMFDEENLNCLVYKVKNTSQRQEEEKKTKKDPAKVLDKNSSANIPSIFLKRKMSKAQQQAQKMSQKKVKNVNKNQLKDNQQEDFSQLNIYLQKIQQGFKAKTKQIYLDDVKRSFKVCQSLNMDPFL